MTPLWSLAVEEQFYFLWPAALLLVLRRRRWASGLLCGVIVALSAWGAVLDLRGATALRVEYAPDTRMQGILIGCLLAFVYAGPRRLLLVKWSRRALLPALALMVWLAAGYSRLGIVWPYHQGSLQAFDVASAVLLVCALEGIPALRVLSFGPLVWLGTISYSLYLWHRPVAAAFGVIPDDHYARAGLKLAALVAAIAISAVSYYLVERRFIRRRPIASVEPPAEAIVPVAA